jgi:AmmeMemoRadiSam system protein B/AmmeMemoRadiSam system protein A
MAIAEAPASMGAAIPGERPELSGAQKTAILAAAGELLYAAVHDQPAVLSDPTLANAANEAVAGAFVSLKRQGHLRACCGGMHDRPLHLAKALYDASLRTALDDIRFPPISPTELAHLDLEVWILFSPRPVLARGEERAQAVVTGGKHGLVVTRGEARGLLLPGVALEAGWDSRRFLEQVCVKAGLHPSVWKEDDTIIMTFEGEAIRGRIDSPLVASNGTPFVPIRREDLPAYAAFCRDNIRLLGIGATPNYYLTGVPDGTVNGIVARVHTRGNNDGFSQLQISLRPGIPLQSSLFALAQATVQKLAAQGFPAQRLDDLEVDLTVFCDPAMHGTVAKPDLRGLDSKRRALLVIERNKTGVSFNATATPEHLLAETAKQAAVSRPASASIFSVETLSSSAQVIASNVPRAIRGPAVRPPGVAGSFYPADADALSKLVTELLGEDCPKSRWPAALIPHAGLRFSGSIAAAALKRLEIPRTVIVIGPKHTSLGVEWAVAPHQTWSLPGCTIESNFMLARRLAQSIPGLEMDTVAHQREHAIEVELPFLARLAPGARVVGIALEPTDLASCMRFADGLAEVISAQQDRPLLLISSDMNHFASDRENRRLDTLAIEAMERLDPEDVYETVTENFISMCGLVPAVIVMQTLRLLGGLNRAERVAYATSADVSGDTSRVVGYAGMLFS